MIRRHDFNTRWWGRPVGIVDDPGFFDLPAAERERQLAPFSWAEFKAPLAPDLDRGEILAAGFVQADVQIPFRIGLSGIEDTASLEGLSARSADEAPFDIPDGLPATFRSERFFCLPGVTEAKINERYRLWGQRLIEEDPTSCLQVHQGQALQGWFLSSRRGRAIELSLAMLSRHAVVSGALLYHKALREYARRGAQVGSAGFSVSNSAVLNIYAKLGARFLAPIGIWLWNR